jgi:hypothetical protein
MSDLFGTAARLREVRAARRRFLLLWAIQGAERSEKIVLQRALRALDRKESEDLPERFPLDD